MPRSPRGAPWSEVAGLVHRGDDGQLVFNPPRANVPLDDDLMPARELRRQSYYLTSKGVSTGIKIDKVAGSRGCPFNCKFCNFSINPWGVKRCWTPRSAESIVREIEQIDADLIFFVDDVFTHQPDRVAEICDLLIAKRIRKHYIVNARLEIAKRPDVIRKMEQAGFLALLIGVESTQDATLKSMGKGFTIEQIRQRFEVLRKSKMIINAYFIVGNIGETEEQMLSTASFARSIGVDLIHVSRLRNEPYSGLSELVEQTPGYHIDADGFVYSDAYSAQHIANLRKRIDRRFHSPLHVAGVVLKLLRILHWRVMARAALTIPVFLTLLIATQAARKVRKWMGMLGRSPALSPPCHQRQACLPFPPPRRSRRNQRRRTRTSWYDAMRNAGSALAESGSRRTRPVLLARLIVLQTRLVLAAAGIVGRQSHCLFFPADGFAKVARFGIGRGQGIQARGVFPLGYLAGPLGQRHGVRSVADFGQRAGRQQHRRGPQ